MVPNIVPAVASSLAFALVRQTLMGYFFPIYLGDVLGEDRNSLRGAIVFRSNISECPDTI